MLFVAFGFCCKTTQLKPGWVCNLPPFSFNKIEQVEKNPNLHTLQKQWSFISQWACVKPCHWFLNGQAAQQCILFRPVIYVYFMSYIYVLCHNWLLKSTHANSISCLKVTYLLLVFSSFFDVSSQ
jgi:hypothetical protein